MAYLKINDDDAVVIKGLDANTELSIEQIAYIIGMSKTETKQLIKRALRKLSSPTKTNKNLLLKLWQTHKTNLVPEHEGLLRGIKC